MRAFTGSRIKPYYLLGVVGMMLAWEFSAVSLPGIVPRLAAVGSSLLLLAQTGELWRQLGVSLQRSLTGLSFGAALGLLLGTAAGLWKPAYYFFKPLMGTLLSSPAVVVMMLAMVWFGVGSFMPVFVTALFTVPVMYVSVVEGMELVDAEVLEMAAVFRISRWALWWNIYLPALATAVLTGLAFAAGTAFRKTIMAELLGSNDGIGYAMAMTRFNLDVARLFAWVAICLCVGVVVQRLFVKPVASYLRKWRDVNSESGVVHE